MFAINTLVFGCVHPLLTISFSSRTGRRTLRDLWCSITAFTRIPGSSCATTDINFQHSPILRHSRMEFVTNGITLSSLCILITGSVEYFSHVMKVQSMMSPPMKLCEKKEKEINHQLSPPSAVLHGNDNIQFHVAMVIQVSVSQQTQGFMFYSDIYHFRPHSWNKIVLGLAYD